MSSSTMKLSTTQTLPKGQQSRPAMTKEAMPPNGKAKDAIALLRADHKEVDHLLGKYEEADDSDKEAIAQQICTALRVHAQIEEEILYPAAREVLDEEDDELVNEADVEHASIKQLIAEVQESSPDDEHYDAKVKVIGEYVRHHVKEEEKELFPKLERSDLDTKVLGEQLAERKAELLAAEGA